jgi:hypothetical protein
VYWTEHFATPRLVTLRAHVDELKLPDPLLVKVTVPGTGFDFVPAETSDTVASHDDAWSTATEVGMQSTVVVVTLSVGVRLVTPVLGLWLLSPV